MRDTAPTHGDGREGSMASGARYAGFDTEDGYVVYDPEAAGAWIQSDATVDPAERA